MLVTHLLSARDIIGECHLWLNTTKESDLKYVISLEAHWPDLFRRVSSPLPVDVNRSVSCFYGDVFGLGNDTKLWSAVSCGRAVTVIEDDPAWIAAAARGDVEIIGTQYSSRVGVPSPFTSHFQELLSRHAEWGVVFVDGPRGAEPSDPGREQSIRLAAEIRLRSGAAVFLHDYERPWEQHCASIYLGPPDETVSTAGDPRLLACWKVRSPSIGVDTEFRLPLPLSGQCRRAS